MGRDTIQLENAVSTISQEYLLEFTFEYGIPESLHPELPGPEDPIVEFPKGKVGVYTKFFEFANFCIPISQFLFDIFGQYQIHLSQLSVIGVAKQTTEEKHPQCYTKPFDSIKNWNNRFFWVDEKVFLTVVDWRINTPKDEKPSADFYSAVAVATLNTRHMDLFNLISAPNPTKVKIRTRPRAAHEVPLLTATASRVIHMRDTTMALGSSRTPATIEKSPLDFADEDPPQVITEKGDEATAESTLGGKSLAAMGIEVDSTSFAPATQETPMNVKSVSDLDPLSYAEPRPIPKQDITQSSRKTPIVEDSDSEKSTSFTSMVGSPGSIYQSGWGVTNNCRLDTPAVCQDVVDHIVPTGNNQVSQQVSTLQAQITDEERIKAAFEKFKKYEDDRVNSRCAEMDARLDVLSIDFHEELYPHMLTAIVGRRWVIGHGLRLAIMKCAESTELRKVFADVVSARIAKGMSEGLKHRVEHEKAKVDLAAIEAYDPEVDTKYFTALHALKDLKYPLWIRKLRPNSFQLKIPVYPEVRNPKDPWSFTEEILLEDAIAANISRTEKKKKCRVVYHTHRVGFAHHARSDGVSVSVPTIASQGLAILLADVATQTEITEDEASSRLLRSKSLPPMYNLDWP
uniref:Transposase (Putative), gypsy type n=1 Tax=Tanacetum cinerariifolium TaxID=118510 RepID=A0A6L2LG16_TANCI|nr:hypothetical protein [Tanacetum cinerariifolium]